VLPDDLKHHRGQWGENGVNWGESRITVKLQDGRILKRDAPTFTRLAGRPGIVG